MVDRFNIHLLSNNDYVLVPFLAIILFAISRYIWLKKLRKIIPYRFIVIALILRLLSCCFNLYLAEYYYDGLADTTQYYTDVTNLKYIVENNSQVLIDLFELSSDQISTLAQSNNDYNYLLNNPSARVVLFGLPISFLSFNSYLCISFCFAFFSLIGSMCLYKFFYNFYPTLYKKLALATLFLPSVFFWTSSFYKDPLSFGGMGIFVYYFYKVSFKKRNKLYSIIFAVISASITFMIKPYILSAVSPAFTIWIFLNYRKTTKNEFTKFLIPASLTFILAILIFAGNQFLENSSRSDVQRFSKDNILIDAKNLSESYEVNGGGSNFSIGTFDANISSAIQLFPIAFITGLFRPFPWEIRSVLMALSSIENIFFLFFTLNMLLRVGFTNFFKKIFNDPLLLFCFLFTCIFIISVTLSTSNFGTLARYRIPILPFYLVMLFVLRSKFTKQAVVLTT
jgi:hypothetical protein